MHKAVLILVVAGMLGVYAVVMAHVLTAPDECVRTPRPADCAAPQWPELVLRFLGFTGTGSE
jgi:hypothetical protein